MTATPLSGTIWDYSASQLINVANDFLHRWEFGVEGAMTMGGREIKISNLLYETVNVPRHRTVFSRSTYRR